MFQHKTHWLCVLNASSLQERHIVHQSTRQLMRNIHGDGWDTEAISTHSRAKGQSSLATFPPSIVNYFSSKTSMFSTKCWLHLTVHAQDLTIIHCPGESRHTGLFYPEAFCSQLVNIQETCSTGSTMQISKKMARCECLYYIAQSQIDPVLGQILQPHWVFLHLLYWTSILLKLYQQKLVLRAPQFFFQHVWLFSIITQN